MRYLSLLIIFSLFSTATQAQILNDQINVEVRIAEFYGNSDNDATSTDEQSMQITAKFSDIIGDLDVGPNCVVFDCFVPCTQEEDLDAPISYFAWLRAWEFDVSVDFELHAWGDEDDFECEFNPGDEDEFMGLASDYNLTNATIVNNREPIVWLTDLGADNGWIFDNANLFNLKPKMIWSYYNGGSCAQPLNFGAINNGETKIHINTNRSTPGELLGEAVIGYTNQISDYDNDSPEAYYSFTLTEAAMVTISTDNAGTDYDTFLGLQAPDCGEIIATNDDTPDSYSSRIVSDLAPGTYTVFVEGYANSQGLFELSITADELVNTQEINPILPISIGPNPTDGLLRLNIGEQSLTKDATVEVMNMQGQLLQKNNITSTQQQVDLHEYPTGTYLLRVITAEGQFSEKILVY